MKRFRVGWMALGGLFFQAGLGSAQSSLDALEQELNEVKQQHQDATAQNLSNFFTQVDAAMGSSDAAVALYQQAGGQMPAPTPVTTVHESESATEKDARLAQDQANTVALGALLELHCGLMHYAALFITSPDQKGLQDDFNAWLQKAAQTYPMVGVNSVPGGNDSKGGHHRRHDDGDGGGGPPPPPLNLNELKGKTMRDSIIAKSLGFKQWGDKEQGGWAVRDIPKLFRTNILDPLRTAPSPATLSAWDALIAMANADEPDADKFASTIYPPLQFDRACDDYGITPSTEKLEAILQIIHSHPTHPQADDWIARAHQLLDDYRAKHGGAAATADNPATAPSAPANSNVVVTTEKQGDATVITTHTNAAPSAPTP
jgi:hypothetical protein